ncbi:hypothetical protein P9112_000569 [Eukaryota sp. TZLM1-RC]
MTVRRPSLSRRGSTTQPHVGAHTDAFEISLFPESLFYHTRFRRPLSYKHLIFLFYFPFGAALCLFRVLFILLSTVLLFDLSRLLRLEHQFFCFWCFVLGVRVSIKNKELLNDDPFKIIVANHICEADALALALAFDQKLSLIVPKFYSKFVLSRKFVTSYFNPLYIQPKCSRHILHDAVHEHLASNSTSPIALFPEGALTNGKVSLLSFNKFMFSLNVPIKPVGIKVQNAFHSVINTDHLTSPVSINILWLLVLPFVQWELTILPTQEAEEGEDSFGFSKRVQKLVARAVDLDSSDFHVKQKYAMVYKALKLRDMSFVPSKQNVSKVERFGFAFGLFHNFKATVSTRIRRKSGGYLSRKILKRRL